MAYIGAKNFLSDAETVVDLLYYEPIARTVVSFVSEDPSTPVTVGVHGDWGAGKSSILRMIEAAFSNRDRSLCLWFNGWTFEGFEDAKAVLLETMIAELQRHRPATRKVKDAAKKLFKRVQWLKLARKAGGLTFAAVTGVPPPEMIGSLLDKLKTLAANPGEAINSEDLQAVTEQADEYLKSADSVEESVPEHIHAFRKEFEALLDAAELDHLVILVDDLDRCLPETAIATLEAIRLFLFVPRTAFVVGADEAMIEYSVRRHFPELTSAPGAVQYARNYLEKLVQVPFRIPALGIAETRTYITLLLARAALGEKHPDFIRLMEGAREELRRPWKSNGLDRSAIIKLLGETISDEVESAVSVSAQIAPILNEGTKGNPRQIKRFLNSMALRLAIAHERGFANDVVIQVLAKLMLAERFATDFYDELARLATSSPDGKVAALARIENAATGAAEVGNGKSGLDKAVASGGELEEWVKRDWVQGWVRIEPRLADVDLRPYIFVTRDKRSFYLGAALSGHLDALLDRLMGQAMVVKGASSDIHRLSDPEAQQLFDEIKARLLRSAKLNTEPPGIQGLIAIAQAKPALQGSLVQVLRQLPIEGLGTWAATSCGTAFEKNDEAKADYHALLESWQKQAQNAPLKAAAAMALKAFR